MPRTVVAAATLPHPIGPNDVRQAVGSLTLRAYLNGVPLRSSAKWTQSGG
jgi:hypothetical protein